MTQQLVNQVALVTGASRGIGKAIAIALAQGCGMADRKSASESEMGKSTDVTENNAVPVSESVAGSVSEGKKELAGSTTMPFIFSSASKIGRIDSIKKFIRTADIKFKVKNQFSNFRISEF